MRKRRNIFSMLAVMAVMAFSAVMLPSCNAIYDDLDPCPQGARLRFVYDYNMEFANAFPSQVDCLTLLVYDKDGKYVTSFTETSSVLSDKNWYLEFPLGPGEYHLQAWGGMSCPDASFAFNGQPSEMSMTALEVGIKPDCLTQPVGKALHHLFYGDLVLDIPASSTDYTEATVYMMKDTNNIRILLQNLNGTPANGDDFIFTITDDNTLLAYDNDVIPGHSYTYYPWATGQAAAGLLDDNTQALLAYAELRTSRLIEGSGARLLIQRRSDSRTIVDIPIINFLLMLKSQEFSSMGSQEFLDRESRWNMIFFLDDSGVWLNTYIKINDWIVRVNNIEA
ncbi:MAG: FimB/Mfa2 family fimbrial subunit [Duncaniella sp.]|nr:FimB/Mfa2 family fimbrial subunit [Duncaniella sp.]